MITLLFIGGLGMGEVLVIALVVLLLFGGKKIPELMRGLGSGVKSFKDGMNGIEEKNGTLDKTPNHDAGKTTGDTPDDATSSAKLNS